MKKFLKRLFFAILAVVLIYLLATSATILIYAKTDNRQQSDVAIVLGAGTINNEASPVFKERVNHAVDLYKSAVVKKIIITGGLGEGSVLADSQVAKQYALSLGVPQEDVLTEETSTVTQENLENAKQLMDKNGYRTAVIVSDPLHMARAMLMAKDAGLNAVSSPTPTSAYKTLDTKLPFFFREEMYYCGYRFFRIWQWITKC
ncbi:MAG: YdcF family protein [Clostridia bacterium]|nr:YdcF family protein [Clostridia bacterium]